MKVGRLYREKIINLLQNGLRNSTGVFFVNFKGLTALQVNLLRMMLKDKDSSVLVAKNKLIKKSFSDLDLDSMLKEETAVVFSRQDIVETAKILFQFKKDNDNFSVKGAFIENSLLDGKEAERISNLPSRQTLLAMAVNCIASPLSSLVNSLNQIILKPLWAISAIKEKKENNK